MKKLVSTVLASMMAISLIPAAAAQAATTDSTVIKNDETGIYNATLYRYVLRHYDTNGDGKLTVGEAKNVTEISITNETVKSVKGIYWFPNLTSLTLQNCGLTSVHSDIGKLTKLETLNLSCNKIAKLPSSVSGLKNLKTVDVSYNKLTALPTAAKAWTKATSLDLSNNAMTQIPTGSLPYMKALTSLDLSNNKIANATSATQSKLNALKTLTKLTKLDLSGNNITSFPTTAIGAMTKLTALYLQDNALTSIPSTIGKLTALKTLNAANNNITSLSSSITKCTKLKVLNLANNKLSTMPNLSSLKNLKCTSTNYYALNLCGNKLSQTVIRKNTNSSLLSAAWVKRQTTKTFNPITEIECDALFAVSGLTLDVSKQYTINPSNATYKTVKYSIDQVSAGLKASISGSNVTLTKTDNSQAVYFATVNVIALDGSGEYGVIFITVY
jgi:Ran GTPase-activating protein (RanGAP) involved in mRNA processing and transport